MSTEIEIIEFLDGPIKGQNRNVTNGITEYNIAKDDSGLAKLVDDEEGNPKMYCIPSLLHYDRIEGTNQFKLR
jgi:hypothetical protein